MTTASMYGLFLASLANREIDLGSDTLKVMLCDDSYTPAQDTHQYLDDVTGEVAGDGYTTGGATLSGVTVTYDAGSNTLTLDANDPSWADSTIKARYAIFYDATPGSDATRPLIAYVDFEDDVSTTNGDFSLVLDADGIISLTVA